MTFTLFIFFIVYQILQIVASPLIIIAIGIMQLKRSLMGNIAQRLGYVPRSTPGRRTIWLHAVSVGEVLSLQELIITLKAANPSIDCYVTVGTVTGMHMAQTQLTHIDHVSYLPYDFLLPMMMAYARIKPTALIIVESDLWPNLIMLGKLTTTPLILLNARISERSRKRPALIQKLFARLYNCFDIILAQSEQDKKNFESLDVTAAVEVLGNLKAYNVVGKKERVRNHQPSQRSYATLLIGSMHPGEVDIYLTMFMRLRIQHSQLRLILAPRHFGWREELIARTHNTGLRVFVWTEGAVPPVTQSEMRQQKMNELLENYDIILVCTLGELFSLYQYADLFFLGGTFVTVGGHNLLEPAVWGITPIVGPHYHNCTDIVQRLTNVKGCAQVDTTEALEAITRTLLDDSTLRCRMGAQCQAWLYQEAQQVQKTVSDLAKKL
jgi:3-deoxy-D-manno-octulosonic-acid transferase